MTTVQNAKNLAMAAHLGQFRRDGKTPYITHPAKVAALLADKDDDTIATAWLHDVLEDTAVDAAGMLEHGVPSAVVNAVELLTRVDGNNYKVYLDALSKNPIARTVKIADMLANLTDSPTPRQVEKYTKAILAMATTPTP